MNPSLILTIPGSLRFSWTVLLTIISLSAAHAQTDSIKNAQTDSIKNKPDMVFYRKNVLKMNLGAALALKSYNFSYEHMLGPKVSFVAGYNTMSERRLSELSLMRKLIDQTFDADDEVRNDLDRIEVANTAYTGEFRFYMGKHPGPRGFYIALFGRYAETKVNYQYQFDGNARTYDIPVKSKFKGFAGGLLLGTQCIISKRIALDIYVGGHYGKTKGDANGPVDLSSMSAQEKARLKDDLESLVVVRDKQYLTATVSNDGVQGKVSGPLIGLRAGFSLGIAF